LIEFPLKECGSVVVEVDEAGSSVVCGPRPTEWSRKPSEQVAKNSEDAKVGTNVMFIVELPGSGMYVIVDLFLQLPFSDKIKRKYLWDNCARTYNFQ